MNEEDNIAKSTPTIRSDDTEEKSFLQRVNSADNALLTNIPGTTTSSNHSSHKKLSSDSLKGKTSPEKDNAKPPDLEDEDEGGAHDTITSLAGVQMLQKYRRNMASGSRGGASSSSLSSLHHNKSARLEDLFSVEEPLIEDDKESLASTGSPSIKSNISKLTDEDKLSPDTEFVPPDGGYGWFISLGAFIALFWAAGMIKSYGILFSEILVVFPDASVTLASWIPASMTTFALAMAPIASALCQKFNCRWVTVFGSLLCALGISLSSFANGIPFLFCTFGVLTGIGVGLSTTPGIIITARYFDKKRALANMFCLSGTAAGSFILPFAIQNLISTYGFRGATLILGGCMLHICISAALYRPIAYHAKIQKMRRMYDKSDNTDFEALSPVTQEPLEPKTPCNSYIYHADLDKVKHKLNSLVTSEADNISICSSASSHFHHSHNHVIHPNHHSSSDYLNNHSHFHHLRGSMGSLARSLPPGLEHNCSGHLRSSNLNSHEELYWPEFSCPKNHEPIEHDKANTFTFPKDPPTDSGAPLTLRQLYLRQLGSQLSICKSYVLGNSDSCTHNPEKRDPSRSLRNSLFYNNSFLRRGSILFSVEDMTTDSTGILKDTKNPSHPTLNDFKSITNSSKNTSIFLERSQSCEQKMRKDLNRRPRYYSEGCDDGQRFKLSPSVQINESDDEKDFVDNPKIKDPKPKLDKLKKSTSHSKKIDEKTGLRKYIDFMIVKEPLFIMMSITVMTMSLGVPHVLFFLPAHARNLGFPGSDGSKLLAICSVTDMLGRIVLTIVVDTNLVPKHICYGLAILTCGFSVLSLSVIGNQFWAMALSMSAYGLGSGAWFLMIPLLLADYLGVENIGSSYGMIRLFQSSANLFGPIAAGLLKDKYDSYAPAFILMGIIMVSGSLAAFFQPCIANLRKEKDSDVEETKNE
uniref:Major facilitator superfamily (MFS) profile domain-containing protein n=1 Tax=Lepeophtheirus salmonis TaxID=72036 RepID=A0A0K2T0D8_LEPSM